MAGSAAGNPSREDIELLFLSIASLALRTPATKTRCLQVEHRAIASRESHQLVVGAEFDHVAALEHTDPIGMANRRKAMRNENGGRVSCRSENAVEDFSFAADIELSRWFVQQHHSGAEPHGT